MGQEYSLITLSAASATIEVDELADLSYKNTLGNARFMKCVWARHRDGFVIVKLVARPIAVKDGAPYVRAISREQEALGQIPNALAYTRIVVTASTGYLIRQFIRNSLYDRISTRPFLEDVEKKWLAFQLLTALRDCHQKSIFHGDIKTENIVITSSNWLYLTDFSASYKPTYLPADNPANFSFYFDTSGRGTCYLAPERFIRDGEIPFHNSVTAAMDIFSAGCVIAELFLETPIFHLHYMLQYCRGEYDPIAGHVSRISDKHIRDLVGHMIQINPADRLTADEYLSRWSNTAFPGYFSSFLHQYMHSLADPTRGQGPITTGAENMGESDDRIDRIARDYNMISEQLGYHEDDDTDEPSSAGDIKPYHIDIPRPRHRVRRQTKADDGTLIFLNVVVAAIRGTARASSRIRACDLLLAFAERVTDETKLDRILPYVVSLFTDESDPVRVAAVRTATQLTALVRAISPVNSYVFPDYLLPRLHAFLLGHSSQPSAFVRAAYASCIATLATTASRYLDLAHALYSDPAVRRPDESFSSTNGRSLYDASRLELVAEFEDQARAMLSDHDPSVRRAFLGSVGPLCVFFGPTKAIDVIVQHMNTYLNDRDWMLKCAFFETIVAVAVFVGSASLDDFILPLIIPALTDPEEFVIERVIRSLNAIGQLGLFPRPKVLHLIEDVFRSMVHPNLWIRDAACQFVAATSAYLSVADYYTIVIPLLRPCIWYFPSSRSHLALVAALKQPLSRKWFVEMLSWAASGTKGSSSSASFSSQESVFWSIPSDVPPGQTNIIEDTLRRFNAGNLPDNPLDRLPKSKADEGRTALLRRDGLSTEDEHKILLLHRFIQRVVERTIKDDRRAQVVDSTLRPPGAVIRAHTVRFIPVPALFQIPASASSSTVLEPNRPRNRPSSVSLTHEQRMRPDSSDGINPPAQRSPSTPIPTLTSTPGPSPLVLARQRHRQNRSETRYQAGHSYTGRDPTILRLLDGLYLEKYPVDGDEFGPVVPPSNRLAVIRASATTPTTPWRPQRVLVAMLSEHTAAVNRIAVATDHSFFVTVSDDGTAKVWDTARLERHVSYRSRLTYPVGRPDVKMTSVVFVENTSTFAVSTSDGAVVVLRIDQAKDKTSRFGHVTPVRQFALPDNQSAVWMEHYRSDRHSTLLVLTDKCRLIGIDLKDTSILFSIQSPVRHGRAVTFCLDRRRHWAVIGTDHGVLDLWDLRFRILVRSWSFPSNRPIHQVRLAPVRGSKKNRLFVAGGAPHGQVSVWDLEAVACKELYRPRLGPVDNRPSCELVDITNSDHSLLSRFGSASSSINPASTDPVTTTTTTTNTTGGDTTKTTSSSSASPTPTPAPTPILSIPDTGARAVAVGVHVLHDNHRYFVVSAGPDWKIRFWDPVKPDSSTLVSGLETGEVEPTYVGTTVVVPSTVIGGVVVGAGGGGGATATGSTMANSGASTPMAATTGTVTNPTDLGGRNEMLVIDERVSPVTHPNSSNRGGGAGGTSKRVAPASGQATGSTNRDTDSNSTATNSNNNNTTTSARPGQADLDRTLSHAVLRGHLDTINDVALVESPYGMIVSGDRSGVVYVFA